MKVVLYLVILFLIIAVGYEAKQIEELKKMVKNDQPEVTINIDKDSLKSTNNNLHNSKTITKSKQIIQNDKNLDELQKTIQKDFHQLFKDIFGNKEVKKEIKQSVFEFKKGLNQAISELQKQVNSMDKDSANIFNELVKEFGAGEFKTFEDKGEFYSYVIDVNGKHSKVNIDAKNGFLYIDIVSKDEKKDKNSVLTKESQKSIVLLLPKDGKIEDIKSRYKDKKLYITIPKIKR